MADVRKGGAIIVYDYEGIAHQALQAHNAWPKSLEVSALKAGDTASSPRRSSSRTSGSRSSDAEGWRARSRRPPGLADPATRFRRGTRRRPATPCAPSSPSCCPAATSTRPARSTATASMRLATARDELVPLRDDRVRENPAYLTVVLLARVVTRIGADRRTSTPASSRASSPRTWPSCRTSTAGSTRRGTPGRPSPVRSASTSSRST